MAAKIGARASSQTVPSSPAGGGGGGSPARAALEAASVAITAIAANDERAVRLGKLDR
jgi:hypothetical protein